MAENENNVAGGMSDGTDVRAMRCACYDCGRPYGDEYGFPDMVVPKSVWKIISPTGHEGGLLCPSCLMCRCWNDGLDKVPFLMASGPMSPVHTDKELSEIYNSYEPHFRNEYEEYMKSKPVDG